MKVGKEKKVTSKKLLSINISLKFFILFIKYMFIYVYKTKNIVELQSEKIRYKIRLI